LIHNVQIKYDTLADRLLTQVRSRAGEAYAVWLPRRVKEHLLAQVLAFTDRTPPIADTENAATASPPH
jgi:hypothetical protein